MALMEIEDTILEQLRKDSDAYKGAKDFQDLFDLIGRGSDRRELMRMVKRARPEIAIPEIDAAQPIYDEMEKFRQELAEEKAARVKESEERAARAAEDGANHTIAAERKRLREEGWDDEGIKKIEIYMSESGNPDYKSAAAYVRSTVPPEAPLPANFQGQQWNWFKPPEEDADHKLLLKDPQKFKEQEISRFLSESRARRAR